MLNDRLLALVVIDGPAQPIARLGEELQLADPDVDIFNKNRINKSRFRAYWQIKPKSPLKMTHASES